MECVFTSLTTMIAKLNLILLYAVVAFLLSFLLYIPYIRFLRKHKAGKTLREDATSGGKAVIFNKLHAHKAGTPTMGWWLILLITAVLVAWSYLLQDLGYISNTLVTRQETYIILFAFFGMGIWWLIDDRLNIKGKGKARGFSAKAKLIGMIALAAWISYWFYVKLGIDYLNLWPLFNDPVHLGIWYPIITFFITIGIVNAINITDWLDGLAWWMSIMVLAVLAVITFTYWWYLSTTVLGIVIWGLLAFLVFNIQPAKIFMGDSWALALWWLIASLLYLLNIKNDIFIPFLILFALFIIEFSSSWLQIFWKRIFKKKLFTIAPFHHNLENKGFAEHTIVMWFWIVQWILAAITLILIFYNTRGTNWGIALA